MKSVLPYMFAFTTVAMSGAAFGATAPTVPGDEAGIKVVMDKFQQAIKNKQENDILQLFTSNTSPITASASEKAFEFVKRTKKADAPKVMDSTSGKFAAAIAKDKASTEETYANVKIDSDGSVASVSFDFVFLGGGEPKNLGKEAWLMVKTVQGWKISSIVYSINFPEKS